MGAGLPECRTTANQAARWMAPALPVFAGKPAPTGRVQVLSLARSLWEQVYPRMLR
ncbi:diguanylate cyclase [Pseudomonas oryziphila]|uniref:Diguanylate cyclase n=1 Tax=Pseudomonas oryziphila TaxID=2894079 RepID=A0ABM7CL57_9PSED|nr:diguanylate cyclase [Pseudomonas oryziphila]